MLFTTLLPILLPLALARPHHPEHIAHRRLVARAGAAYDNETQAEISAYNHEHESSSTAVISSSAAVTSASPSAVEAVGSALTAFNTPSSAVTTSAQSSAIVDQSSAAAAASPSPTEEAVTSQDAQPSPSASADAIVVPSSSSASDDEISSAPTSIARSTQTTVVMASRSSTVVRVTASASASASAAAANTESDKIAGLPKTTFIAIIVVAAVIALAGIGWTVFRKLRLGPSRKFDEKMRPIDFSPHNDAFLEKSHHRSSSNSSAAMQRQEFMAELDSKHVDGVPDHDFTAGGNMAGQGAYEDYHQDPYASAEAYEYDAAYHYDDVAQHHASGYDQPTQDTGAGYTDLQRGNSIGSGSGHGHGYVQPQYPVEQFPMPDHYLGRPTGGSEGPYAQASQRY